MKSISLSVTLEQLAKGLHQLNVNELEELELLLLKDELEKRSVEVKKGKSLSLEELKSLRDV
ncbi:MAG: hypothetical protein A2Z21_03275 [Candidatus Fraserbacteria bacterium RBG_16_55_9]|uniref:Uncharacterized protein n=1 Tax=Fraserbacteria sp. (strain RBG_16_55_9) TaxID=1817864 RepID=A0A1F5V1B1_FRAXR|nr:MAG: hypothetical protein A2Z21_03275 [Candidatus Fraserbacteria bacterium RBG_16_55_9]